MPLFICSKCHAIENTACGHYWGTTGSKQRWFEDEALDRTPLCSECCPKTFKDGSSTGRGEWHGRFDKEIATTERVDQVGRDRFVYTAGL